jgi:hypothetical protein
MAVKLARYEIQLKIVLTESTLSRGETMKIHTLVLAVLFAGLIFILGVSKPVFAQYDGPVISGQGSTWHNGDPVKPFVGKGHHKKRKTHQTSH